jgi:hypothetical protein
MATRERYSVRVILPPEVVKAARRHRIKLPSPVLNIVWDARSFDGMLKDMVSQLRDMSPALKRGAEAMRESFKKNFDSGGRPKWQPPATGTKFSKLMRNDQRLPSMSGKARQRRIDRMVAIARGRSNRGLLVDTGAYRDSVINVGSAHNISRISKDSMVLGTTHPMGLHEHGTRPYVIRPVKAKSLRWLDINGVIFAKEVHHPGVPARCSCWR